ncbi:MAG: BPSS1780 family membrane protein [Desulfobacteraceae bacterium]|nr:BPSS1780 family membrane protein [Desulfobacteraceae bacterium]
MKIDTASASRGIAWYGEGWRIVRSQFGMWILLSLIFWGINLILNFIPFIGPLALSFITPALTGGLFKAARDCKNGQYLSLNYISIAFKDPATRNATLTLGAINIGFSLAAALIMIVALSGGGVFMLLHKPNLMAILHVAAGAGLVSLLLISMLALLLAMAMLYAVPIVMLTDIEPIEAMKLSIRASGKNMLSLSVYGVVYIFLVLVSVLTFGLGLIILMPITVGSLYSSYEDIFSHDSQEPAEIPYQA